MLLHNVADAVFVVTVKQGDSQFALSLVAYVPVFVAGSVVLFISDLLNLAGFLDKASYNEELPHLLKIPYVLL